MDMYAAMTPPPVPAPGRDLPQADPWPLAAEMPLVDLWRGLRAALSAWHRDSPATGGPTRYPIG